MALSEHSAALTGGSYPEEVQGLIYLDFLCASFVVPLNGPVQARLDPIYPGLCPSLTSVFAAIITFILGASRCLATIPQI
jgi:hypothetical protein